MSPYATHRQDGVDQPARLRRFVAALGVATLALVGSVAAAAPASAALGKIGADTNQSSITIHKRSQPGEGGGHGDGTQIGTPPGEPINGIEFSIYRLDGIDLTTNDGWDQLNKFRKAQNAGTLKINVDDQTVVVPTSDGTTTSSFTLLGTERTAGDGTAAFTGLSFGVYVVVEGADTGNNNIVAKAAPFLVSLPFASATAEEGWLYDAHVYPKNSVPGVEKQMTSASVLLGGDVEWTVTVQIPHLADGKEFEDFTITDTLDPRLTLVKAEVTIDGAPVDATVGDSTQPVTVTPELEVVNENQGKELTIEYTTQVASLGTGDSMGAINNTAIATINGIGFTSNEATVSYGQATIIKHAKGNRDETLEGASFALYADETDATTVMQGGSVEAEPLWVGVSDAEGKVDIGDEGAVTPAILAGTYYLVETDPPAGYVGQRAVFPVIVTAGEGNTTTIYVANEEIPAWELPFTGGNGTLWFTVGGVSLLVVALGAGLLIARRNQAKA